MRNVFAVALVLLVVTAAPGAETHPFSVHDMLAMDRISDPRVSPGGDRVLFVVRETDLEANAGRTDIWMAGTDGQGLRRLTSSEAGDVNPRWSPDGRTVWFVSTRSGSPQIWRLSLDGGEAMQVTDLPLDVANLTVSPLGDRLAFTMDVFVDCDKLECTADRLAQREKDPVKARVYDQLLYRHWDTWSDGRRSHLFVMPAAGGALLDLTKGMDADVPSKPFGGTEEIAFSPDGRTLVFAARVAGREEAWSTNFDLWSVPVDGSGAPRNLTADNPAWDTGPAFSPDGKRLAWLAMSRPGYEADRFRIMVRDVSASGSAARELAPGWDRSPGALAWSPDGNTLYATADDLGRQALFAVDVGGGAVRTVVGGGTVDAVTPTGDRLLFAMDDLRSPVELYTVRSDGTDFRRVTRLNDEKVAAARMGEPEPFVFKGWNDEPVHGFVVKPVDFDPEKKYPVAFLIHGGPQGSFGDHFHYRWNPQAYAGAGYASVMIDFHGSTGYGQAFTDAIRGDWGGKPLEDLRRGLAAALESHPWMDGERVAALGASYGGYMINWIAGNWPDRFTCLVSHDGNLDERAAYFTTEELWFPEWEHRGTPWENPAGYEEQNPVNFVQNWKTPMLVIHGALDYRVVDTAGMAAFTVLQRKGIPSKFIYFPDENHWVLKPRNSIFWHEQVIDWIDRWTKP